LLKIDLIDIPFFFSKSYEKILIMSQNDHNDDVVFISISHLL